MQASKWRIQAFVHLTMWRWWSSKRLYYKPFVDVYACELIYLISYHFLCVTCLFKNLFQLSFNCYFYRLDWLLLISVIRRTLIVAWFIQSSKLKLKLLELVYVDKYCEHKRYFLTKHHGLLFLDSLRWQKKKFRPRYNWCCSRLSKFLRSHTSLSQSCFKALEMNDLATKIPM